MALHLNLYHEVLAQKAIKARDPLRLSLMGLGVIALGFAGFYVYKLSMSGMLTSELNGRQAELAKFKAKAAEAVKREGEIKEQISSSINLVKHIENRVYWAPILEKLVRNIPPQVQITRLTGDLPESGGSDPLLARAPGRTITLNFDGVAAGQNARAVAEDFRRSLEALFSDKWQQVSATFRSLEDGSENVKLNGEDLPTANFGISLAGKIPDPVPQN